MTRDKKSASKASIEILNPTDGAQSNTTAVFRAPGIVDPDDLMGEGSAPKRDSRGGPMPPSLDNYMFEVTPEQLSPEEALSQEERTALHKRKGPPPFPGGSSRAKGDSSGTYVDDGSFDFAFEDAVTSLSKRPSLAQLDKPKPPPPPPFAGRVSTPPPGSQISPIPAPGFSGVSDTATFPVEPASDDSLSAAEEQVVNFPRVNIAGSAAKSAKGPGDTDDQIPIYDGSSSGALMTKEDLPAAGGLGMPPMLRGPASGDRTSPNEVAVTQEANYMLQEVSSTPQDLPSVIASSGALQRIPVLLEFLEEEEIPPQRFQELTLLEGNEGKQNILVRDHDLQRVMVLKRLKTEERSEHAQKQFARETRILGQLQHPGILPLYDIGIDDEGGLWHSVRHFESETMASIIRKLAQGYPSYQDRFPLLVRNQIFLKILEIVQYAHELDILHCDLKPSNILIGDAGEVILTGWGLELRRRALVEEAITDKHATPSEGPSSLGAQQLLYERRHETLLGTPAYMSPEQAKGLSRRVDTRSDVYSLGVLYYEWISGQHYLESKKLMRSMLNGVSNDDVTPLHQLENTSQSPIPREISYFAQKAMEKLPNDRYQSVQEMREELLDTLQGKFTARCAVTFVRRWLFELLRFIDQQTTPSLVVIGAVAFFALYGLLRFFGSLLGFLF